MSTVHTKKGLRDFQSPYLKHILLLNGVRCSALPTVRTDVT